MDRNGMSMSVKVNGQWVSLDAYREKKNVRKAVASIALLGLLFSMFLLGLWVTP